MKPSSKLKTYSHLAGARRIPSEYEIVTTKLLYYTERGFEVNVPLTDWYHKYQAGSQLRCAGWDDFYDPRETTYTKYTELQSQKEAHVEGILRAIEDGDHDETLGPKCVRALEALLSPLRYPVHGLQMISAYVGQMAPSGRITIACALQAADEMRRVQRFAYRQALLQQKHPTFGARARESWQSAPALQPLRRAVEQLLVTYDWGEAFAALNLVLKPAFDQLVVVELPRLIAELGDPLLEQITFSLDEDCRWHRQWSAALVAFAVGAAPENARALRAMVSRFVPMTQDAVTALGASFGHEGAACAQRAIEHARAYRARIGVEP